MNSQLLINNADQNSLQTTSTRE